MCGAVNSRWGSRTYCAMIPLYLPVFSLSLVFLYFFHFSVLHAVAKEKAGRLFHLDAIKQLEFPYYPFVLWQDSRGTALFFQTSSCMTLCPVGSCICVVNLLLVSFCFNNAIVSFFQGFQTKTSKQGYDFLFFSARPEILWNPEMFLMFHCVCCSK